MPVGVPLIDLRRDLRAETGQTLNPSQMVQAQASQDLQLNRQQRELWDAYDWPHLSYWIDVPVAAGQSLLAFPDDMPFDQINHIYWVAGGEWRELEYGIRAFDVALGQQVGGTPTRWMNKVTVTAGITDPLGQMMILPVPVSDGMLRLEGQAPVPPMIDPADKCVLDSDVIVLFAAAEVLATAKAEVAQLKLTKAQNHLRRLLQNNGSEKRRNYSMGSSYGSTRSRSNGAVPYIDYIP